MTWIYIQTSISEGLPVSVIEAGLTGKCVVCTNVGGCAELLANPNSGARPAAQRARAAAAAALAEGLPPRGLRVCCQRGGANARAGPHARRSAAPAGASGEAHGLEGPQPPMFGRLVAPKDAEMVRGAIRGRPARPFVPGGRGAGAAAARALRGRARGGAGRGPGSPPSTTYDNPPTRRQYRSPTRSWRCWGSCPRCRWADVGGRRPQGRGQGRPGARDRQGAPAAPRARGPCARGPALRLFLASRRGPLPPPDPQAAEAAGGGHSRAQAPHPRPRGAPRGEAGHWPGGGGRPRRRTHPAGFALAPRRARARAPRAPRARPRSRSSARRWGAASASLGSTRCSAARAPAAICPAPAAPSAEGARNLRSRRSRPAPRALPRSPPPPRAAAAVPHEPLHSAAPAGAVHGALQAPGHEGAGLPRGGRRVTPRGGRRVTSAAGG